MAPKLINNKIKVVIVDDHPITRDGIIRLLNNYKEITVVGEAANADDLLSLINKKKPDIALVDINLECQANGIDIIKAIQHRYPGVRTIVLSMYKETSYIEQAIRAGARGYVPKSEASNRIVDAIKKVMDGGIYLSEQISDSVLNDLLLGKKINKQDNISNLSDREFEVFKLIGQGYKTGEIAKKLNLSKNTIESHRRNIKEKLMIDSNNVLIRTAAQWLVSNS